MTLAIMLSNSSDRKHPQASIWLNYSPYGFRVFLTRWFIWPGFCSHPQCGHVLLLYPLSACSCLLFLLSQPLGPDRVCRVLLLSPMASPPSFNPPCARLQAVFTSDFGVIVELFIVVCGFCCCCCFSCGFLFSLRQ